VPPARDPIDDVSAHTVLDARHALDTLPDGVVIADEHGVVRLVNDRAAVLLGTTREAAEGSPLAEVVAVTNQEGAGWVACTQPYDGLVTRTGVPEQSWVLPSGDEVLVTARIHRAPRHGPVTDVAVSLRSGRARARLDRDRSDLVATVAHELRSPLTSVKGFTATLLTKWERFTDEQKKLMLQTVNSDADRVTRLISELLDVSRIEAGRLELRKQVVDIPAVVQRDIDARVAAGESPDRFRVITTGGLPEMWVDPDKLAQVVGNLVENAVRHGGGTVTVTVGPHGDGAEVTVTDEGDGIPGQALGRIFTKFWRGGSRGGTGLGLYIAKGIVEAHGGAIEAGRAPDGGAVLRFTLPAGTPSFAL
jgi:signal transduction histidine kinase